MTESIDRICKNYEKSAEESFNRRQAKERNHDARRAALALIVFALIGVALFLAQVLGGS